MLYRTLPWLALLAGGCGTTISVTPINPAQRQLRARPPEAVEIFSSGPPPRPHLDIAYLEAEQETHLSFDNTPEFIAMLRSRAADMGCDGLVLGGLTHDADVAASVVGNVNASKKGITATCIIYTAEAATARASTLPPVAPPPVAPPPFAPPPVAGAAPGPASTVP